MVRNDPISPLDFVDPNTIEGTWFGVKQQVSKGKKHSKIYRFLLYLILPKRNYGSWAFFFRKHHQWHFFSPKK